MPTVGCISARSSCKEKWFKPNKSNFFPIMTIAQQCFILVENLKLGFLLKQPQVNLLCWGNFNNLSIKKTPNHREGLGKKKSFAIKIITSNFENLFEPRIWKKSVQQYHFCCFLVSIANDPMVSMGTRVQSSFTAFWTESFSAF